jgi:hypothetical protein
MGADPFPVETLLQDFGEAVIGLIFLEADVFQR